MEVPERQHIPDVTCQQQSLGQLVADTAAIHVAKIRIDRFDDGPLDHRLQFPPTDLARRPSDRHVNDFRNLGFPFFNQLGRGLVSGVLPGVDRNPFPLVGDDAFALQVELNVEAAQLPPIGTRLDAEPPLELLHFILSAMMVAADDQRDTGVLAQDLVLFARKNVGENHDQVGAILDFVHVTADRLRHRERSPGTAKRGFGEIHQFSRQNADDAHANPVDLADQVRLGNEQVSLTIDHIGVQRGEFGLRYKLGDLPPAVVKLMIPERMKVKTEGVGHLVNRHPFKDRGHGASLHQVPAMHHKAGFRGGLLLPDRLGDMSKPSAMLGIGQKPRVQVIQMQDR